LEIIQLIFFLQQSVLGFNFHANHLRTNFKIPITL
jgi:hypothetical protein